MFNPLFPLIPSRSLDEVAAAFVAQQAAAEAAAAAAKAAAEGQQSSAGAHGNGAHAAGGSGHGGFHEGLDPSGKPLPEWKLRLGRYLESNECHVIIIWLVRAWGFGMPGVRPTLQQQQQQCSSLRHASAVPKGCCAELAGLVPATPPLPPAGDAGPHDCGH